MTCASPGGHIWISEDSDDADGGVLWAKACTLCGARTYTYEPHQESMAEDFGPQTDEVTFLLEELLPTITTTQASQIEGWYPVDFAHLPASVRTHVESVDLGDERRHPPRPPAWSSPPTRTPWSPDAVLYVALVILAFGLLITTRILGL